MRVMSLKLPVHKLSMSKLSAFKLSMSKLSAALMITGLCLLCLAMPAVAASGDAVGAVPGVAAAASGSTAVRASADNQPSIPELYAEVDKSRQALLEYRLEVVKKAGEAKQRLEELLRSDKQGARSADALKKDLETIKEAQRVLTTILSDIVNTASAGNPLSGAGGSGAAAGGDAAQSVIQGGAKPGNTENPGNTSTPGNTSSPGNTDNSGNANGPGNASSPGSASNPGNAEGIMPSREYLESLIELYNLKSQQLAKVAESLDGVVALP